MKKIKVAVLMGGKSAEHDVSLASGKEVLKNISKEKYEVFPIIIPKNGTVWKLIHNKKELLAGNLATKESSLAVCSEGMSFEKIPQIVDVVFIVLHGPFGEDGAIQGMLEMAGIPYTGAGILASALGMDKPLFRKIVKKQGINVPRSVILKETDRFEHVWEKFKLPIVIKPSSQGSSIGVSIIHQKDDLERALKKAFVYGSRVLVEEYLAGTEVTCGVLGNDDLLALPVVEIIPKKEFFDYEAKYVPGQSDEIVPARISAELTEKVQQTAIDVYKAIGCRGLGRVDMIVVQGDPYVLEINTIPGFTENSLLPKAALAAGISFPELIDRLINFSLEVNW